MDIKCDLRIRERPHIAGDTLHVSMSEGTTARYVVTNDFIAVDYLCDDGRVDWYFYLNGWKVG